MILTKPRVSIMSNIHDDMLQFLERAGRTCYKSESRITKGSAETFIKGILQKGHHTIIEHVGVTVKFVCNRGISHELVRHRLATFSQESTRYCNYKGGVEYIVPFWVSLKPGEYVDTDSMRLNYSDRLWYEAMRSAENYYIDLLSNGWKPEMARGVLPNDLKTEVVMTANLREWRHVFNQRALGTTGRPHPQMQELAVDLLCQFQQQIPIIFDDLKKEGVTLG